MCVWLSFFLFFSRYSSVPIRLKFVPSYSTCTIDSWLLNMSDSAPTADRVSVQSNMDSNLTENSTISYYNQESFMSYETMRIFFFAIAIITVLICLTICTTVCLCICLKRYVKGTFSWSSRFGRFDPLICCEVIRTDDSRIVLVFRFKYWFRNM